MERISRARPGPGHRPCVRARRHRTSAGARTCWRPPRASCATPRPRCGSRPAERTAHTVLL